jgi:predicted nucleic acid-binding protein
MIVQLDTNTLAELVVPVSAVADSIDRWLGDGNHIAASAIAWSEFCNGPLTDEARAVAEISLNRMILPFGQAMAEKASLLFNATGRRRGSHPDCMIAACAIISDAPLSTLNLKDFERFVPFGLRLHSF